jgi:GDP-L-fucose synthase
MNLDSKIYVAGHTGLLGSAIVRMLKASGFNNLILKTSSELNLINQMEVDLFFNEYKPEYVFICAGKVGGINANNTKRAEFIYKNIMIQFNIIHAAYLNKCKKLLAVGSSCIYPRNAPQPIKEEYLLKGELEPTNEPYAISKIAALKMCEAYRQQYGCNFISAMPTNLYGPNDNYDLLNSHVLPAMIKKFHEATINENEYVTIWGTGKVRREFLYVDDCAGACLFLMENYNDSGHVNIGTGKDIELNELAEMIKSIVGYKGRINHDLSKPDGMAKKLLDVSKINSLGWKAKMTLEEGIRKTYKTFYAYV